MQKKTFAAAGASLALAAALVGVGLTSTSVPVQAQTASAGAGIEHIFQTPPSGQPGQPGRPGRGDPQQWQQHQQDFMNSVASHLGVSPDKLTDAFKQARIDQVNQALAANRITKEQADRMIQAIQSGQGFARPGGPGPQGQGGPAGQRGFGGGPFLAASVLQMTPEQLRTEMQGGKSLAQVAQDHGVNRDDLKTKLTAAHKTRLDQAKANGRITDDQEQQMLSRFTANLDKMIDFVPGQGGPGQGPRGPRGPR